MDTTFTNLATGRVAHALGNGCSGSVLDSDGAIHLSTARNGFADVVARLYAGFHGSNSSSPFLVVSSSPVSADHSIPHPAAGHDGGRVSYAAVECFRAENCDCISNLDSVRVSGCTYWTFSRKKWKSGTLALAARGVQNEGSIFATSKTVCIRCRRPILVRMASQCIHASTLCPGCSGAVIDTVALHQGPIAIDI